MSDKFINFIILVFAITLIGFMVVASLVLLKGSGLI